MEFIIFKKNKLTLSISSLTYANFSSVNNVSEKLNLKAKKFTESNAKPIL